MDMISKKDIVFGENIDSYIIRERFKSRKNEVYLVDLKKAEGQMIPGVLKKYITSKENKSKEAFLLKVLRENGLNVPQIYFEGDDFLILEYLNGETLLDIIANLEKNQGEDVDYKKNHKVLFQLFEWLQKLYCISKDTICKSYFFEDINLRNFIVNDEIYGIDLEECCCRGYRERDGGRFCAFLLTYSPAFTKWKLLAAKQAVEIMTRDFEYSRELLKKEIEKEFVEIQNRRGIEIPHYIIEKIF